MSKVRTSSRKSAVWRSKSAARRRKNPMRRLKNKTRSIIRAAAAWSHKVRWEKRRKRSGKMIFGRDTDSDKSLNKFGISIDLN